ncbi:uncharacterized protein LOC134265856, partial [Saccostrea cucullata]|uniref:uncharacterized protein LOC134265856 n=1 Tax=Saccostrea cuccullata TaxID=36930 RepID=UPI002ED10E88
IDVGFFQAENFNKILKSYSDSDVEFEQQNRYLSSFGLQRNAIVGDGNCLFRSISFSLYGNQDNHLQLRNLAVDTLRGNMVLFQNYFLQDPGTPEEQINNLGRPNSYAGQECILALSMALDINILVTLGGDVQNNPVSTYENTFSQGQPQQTIHIAWRRAGGGHYEAVTEIDTENQEVERSDPIVIGQDHINTRPWLTEFSKPVNMEDFKIRPPQSLISTLHSYVKSEETSPNDDLQTQKKTGAKICPKCKVSFKKLSNLKSHIKKFHSSSVPSLSENTKRKLQPCMISSCAMKFLTIDQLLEHAINAHDADIKVEHLTFESLALFSDFRSKEEMSSNTRFVRRSRPQVNKKGGKTYSLVCHRNGPVSQHRAKGVQPKTSRKNKKGHCQINNLCPARMSVCEMKDGKVMVKYVKSHTHSLSFEQTKYLPIPDSLKSEILNMLSLKIPINCIIDKVREHFSGRGNRDNLDDLKYYHLIDRKKIHSLKTKLADPTIIQDSNDAISTSLKVEALRQESFNPVLIFKQQGIEDPSKRLNKEDFILAIMTKEQLNMYKSFASRILCMDSTHKTNSYSFKLITLMVPDEFRKGYPVAFCISNREDETTMSLFLSSVKNLSPETKVKVIMTDDDNAGWNAAKSVYGSDLQHFLCTWHIQRSWIKNIHNHFRNDVHKTEVYCYLCALLQAKSENDFIKYKDALVSKLNNLNPSFLNYLNDHYFNRPEKWSLCFRKGTEYGNVNTNMFVESFHNQLKTIYFSGKRNRRIDVLLDTLLKIENDHFIRHLQRVSYNNPSDEDIRITDRHRKSLEIDNTKVKQISSSVFSLESGPENYIIEAILSDCSQEHCYTKCKNLPCINLCYHMYKCSCADYHNGHICKHIHKIHSLSRSRVTQEDDCLENDLQLSYPEPANSTAEPKRKSSSIQLQRIEGLLNELGDQVKHPQVKKYRLSTIIKSLESLISGNKACMSFQDDIPAGELAATERIAGNANNILQPRFHATQKKKGRPRKAPLKKPTEDDMKRLLQDQEQPGRSTEESTATTTTDTSHGSVAPYPPLRLVPPPERPIQLSNNEEQNLFSVGEGGLGQPSWMRIPPSMLGRRITVIQNGKPQQIIFTASGDHGDSDHE